MHKRCMVMTKNLTPGACLPLLRGYIHVHVYDHNIQTSSSLKPLSQTLCEASFDRGMKLYIKGRSHMTKMAAVAINRKTLKILVLQNRKYDFET